MIRLLIIADTHGAVPMINRAVSAEENIDGILHLGDTATDLFRATIPDGIRTYFVNGNNDNDFSHLELNRAFEGVRIFACHGHLFRIDRGFEQLYRLLSERDISLAFYGHLHRQERTTLGGREFVNPGYGKAGEYAVASFHDGNYEIEFRGAHNGE